MVKVTYGTAMLSIAKFNECLEFYRDKLGCKVAGTNAGGSIVHFESNGQRFGLFDRSILPEDISHAGGAQPGTSCATLVFYTDDVDETYRVLSEAGVHYSVPPHDFLQWKVRSSVCHDPDGNPVEIAARLA